MKSITFGYLKELNLKIKSKDLTTMKKAHESLKCLILEDLDPGLQMYAKYLEGKYYYLKAKTTYPLQNYAESHLCFKKVFDIARNNRRYVKNSKYHFKYAESAYRLSRVVWCDYQKENYSSLAFSIAANASMLYPKNDSIKWLMSELTK